MTFAAPLRATLRLVTRDKDSPDKPVKDIVEQSVFLGELPLMTNQGTFIINGAERVVVSQLHRSPGVFFDETVHPNGKDLYSARILPAKGPWLEFSMDINDIMYVHIDRRRKLPVSLLLKALGFSKDGELLSLFRDDVEVSVDEELIGRHNAGNDVIKSTGEVILEAHDLITDENVAALQEAGIKKISVLVAPEGNDPGIMENTLNKDPSEGEEDALTRIYNLLRPGDPRISRRHAVCLNDSSFNPNAIIWVTLGGIASIGVWMSAFPSRAPSCTWRISSQLFATSWDCVLDRVTPTISIISVTAACVWWVNCSPTNSALA